MRGPEPENVKAHIYQSPRKGSSVFTSQVERQAIQKKPVDLVFYQFQQLEQGVGRGANWSGSPTHLLLADGEPD